jgi:hypothetical protein
MNNDSVYAANYFDQRDPSGSNKTLSQFIFIRDTDLAGRWSRVLSLDFKPKTRNPRRETQNLAASAVSRREA